MEKRSKREGFEFDGGYKDFSTMEAMLQYIFSRKIEQASFCKEGETYWLSFPRRAKKFK